MQLKCKAISWKKKSDTALDQCHHAINGVNADCILSSPTHNGQHHGAQHVTFPSDIVSLNKLQVRDAHFPLQNMHASLFFFCWYFTGLIPRPHDAFRELLAQRPTRPVTEHEPLFSIVTVHTSSFSEQFNKR